MPKFNCNKARVWSWKTKPIRKKERKNVKNTTNIKLKVTYSGSMHFIIRVPRSQTAVRPNCFTNMIILFHKIGYSVVECDANPFSISYYLYLLLFSHQSFVLNIFVVICNMTLFSRLTCDM